MKQYIEMAFKISIITPVRNGENHLRTCIESVLQQDYENYEHIVIDGNSTDGTVDILKSYKHLRWISEPDKGTGDAFNKGVRMSTGDILCILPADDCVKSDAFKKIIDQFQSHPDCAWVAGFCDIIDDQGKEIRTFITWYKNLLIRHHSFQLLLTENYLSAMAVYFKKELLSEFGPFDIYQTTEYAMWLHFASKYKLFLVKDLLASFRIHQKSMTGSYHIFPAKRALTAVEKFRRPHPFLTFIHYINYLKLVAAYSILNRLLK
jgi:glycosyltransferase involved in cell wall biosynthesis